MRNGVGYITQWHITNIQTKLLSFRRTTRYSLCAPQRLEKGKTDNLVDYTPDCLLIVPIVPHGGDNMPKKRTVSQFASAQPDAFCRHNDHMLGDQKMFKTPNASGKNCVGSLPPKATEATVPWPERRDFIKTQTAHFGWEALLRFILRPLDRKMNWRIAPQRLAFSG